MADVAPRSIRFRPAAFPITPAPGFARARDHPRNASAARCNTISSEIDFALVECEGCFTQTRCSLTIASPAPVRGFARIADGECNHRYIEDWRPDLEVHLRAVSRARWRYRQYRHLV